MRISDESLRNRAIVGSDGHQIGEVVRVFLDSNSLRVVSIQARLRDEIVDQLGSIRGIFWAGTLEIPVGVLRVSADVVVLTVSVQGLQETLAESHPAATY